MKKSKYRFGALQISPVEDFSIFDGFSCLLAHEADRDLEDFIRNDAARHASDRIAVTYVFEWVDWAGVPLGFATLQNDVVEPESANFDGYLYKALPAVKIGRLGIAADLQRSGLGTQFLRMLLGMIYEWQDSGCRFVTVDARRSKQCNIDVSPFYGRAGFCSLPTRGKTSTYIPMYLDIKRVGPLEGATR